MGHFGGAVRLADPGANRRPTSPFGAAVAALLLAVGAWAAPVSADVIDFDDLPDLTPVTGQYAGLVFEHAVVLTAGVSLNEFEFPPRSDFNVVSDDGGPMTIEFASPMMRVSGYITYINGLRFEAFDAADTSLGADLSDFVYNLALSGEVGSSPSESFRVDSAVGIRKVVITGDPAGSSFTLDDLTFESVANAVPEPSSLALLVVGLLAMRQRRGPGLR